MTHNDRLLIELATGSTVRDAAQAAGVSEATAFRRLKEPDFIVELNRVRGELWDNAFRKLTAGASTAVETLTELMTEAESDSVKLKAAQLILEQGGKLRESIEFEQRLAVLEQAQHEGPEQRASGYDSSDSNDALTRRSIGHLTTL